MTDVQLLERAKSLQGEARRILKEIDLLTIIGTISEPEIVGSVKNGLMIVPDIDIHAWVERPNLEAVANLIPALVKMPTIQKVQFNNYRELRRDDRKDRIHFPHAYYVGLRTVQPSGEWKIDTWFGEKGKIGDYDDSELSIITDEQRLIILRLKEMWKTEKGYRDGVLSTDFYKAVMRHRVKDEKEFLEYLKMKK
ncbi:MAG: hypothetical protein NUV98_04610 [Candidatus Roizmanbacteria bacterium]|nr:hypothetical protein [Candidatus Roizmanbacteria bacterium]